MTQQSSQCDDSLSIDLSLAALDALQEGIIILTSDAKIHYWNSWLSETSEIASEAAVGKTLDEVFPHLAYSRLIKAIDWALKNKLPSFISSTLNKTPLPLTKFGRNIEQSIHVKPLDMPDDQVYCLVRISDVTEMVDKEKLLHLSAAQLKQAKEAADSANRSKSIFLANMSHELRTPLNAVLGFCQLMRADDDFPATHKEKLEIINRSGEHLLSMINDVLDMSKIESGQIQLEEETFDLHQMFKTIASMIQLRTNKKGINFSIIQSPALPHSIIADQVKLRQIIINLLDNAVKHTEDGAINLIANTSPDKSKLKIEIEDTGRGIDAEKLERLFEPFFQINNKQQDGAGLGLAISKRFVELMNGDINVRSEPGQGSVFSFTIPIKITDEKNDYLPEQTLPILDQATDKPAPRLLIVEDNFANRSLLNQILMHSGFDIREAVNGKEGIEQFEEWHPDLIWMDINMPVLDGKQATKRIRSLDNGHNCKIIAVTANSVKDVEDDLLICGFDSVLFKPFRTTDIFNLLEEHLYLRFKNTTTVAQPSQAKLNQADMAALPATWLKQFHSATQSGDIAQMQHQLQALPPEHSSLKDSLTTLVKDYNFDELLKLTKT